MLLESIVHRSSQTKRSVSLPFVLRSNNCQPGIQPWVGRAESASPQGVDVETAVWFTCINFLLTTRTCHWHQSDCVCVSRLLFHHFLLRYEVWLLRFDFYTTKNRFSLLCFCEDGIIHCRVLTPGGSCWNLQQHTHIFLNAVNAAKHHSVKTELINVEWQTVSCFSYVKADLNGIQIWIWR